MRTHVYAQTTEYDRLTTYNGQTLDNIWIRTNISSVAINIVTYEFIAHIQLGLKYYSDMNDAPVSGLLIQTSIETKNHLMDFSDSSWQDCPDTGRITGAYIIFYQGGSIEHVTHVPGPVAQSSAESEYNIEYTAGMALAHFRILIHELLNKDPDIVP